MENNIKLVSYNDNSSKFLEELKLDKEITDNVTSIFYKSDNKYVIKLNDYLVGLCLINKEYGGTYSLDIGIKEEYRKIGIGTKVIGMLTDIISHDDNCKIIILRTKLSNESIKSIAKKFGYSLDYDEIERSIEEGVPSTIYSKPNTKKDIKVR